MSGKKFAVAVGDNIDVPIKFTLKEGRVDKLFSFTLHGNRLEQDVIDEKMKEAEYKFKGALLSMHKSYVDPNSQREGLFTGWTGQRLIVSPSDGSPSEFSTEAFEAMLSIPGVSGVIYKTYQLECAAKEKN